MRRTKEEANLTKEKIMAAALELFSTKGYNAASLDGIASIAGVTRGAVNWHFKSKASLYQELILSAGNKGGALLIAAAQEGGTFKAICKRILVSQWTLLENDNTFRDTLKLMFADITEIPELAECYKLQQESSRMLLEEITGYMTIGINSGELKPGHSAMTLACAFLAYQKGVAVNWLLSPELYSLSAIAEQLADVFIDGL